jgi:hypothetical protein
MIRGRRRAVIAAAFVFEKTSSGERHDHYMPRWVSRGYQRAFIGRAEFDEDPDLPTNAETLAYLARLVREGFAWRMPLCVQRLAARYIAAGLIDHHGEGKLIPAAALEN